MAITEIQSISASAATTSPSVALPASPTAGNLLVAMVSADTAPSGDVTISMVGSGWATAQQKVAAGSPPVVRQAVFYKTAGAAESAIVQATLTSLRYWAMCVVEVHSTSAGGWVLDKTANNAALGTAATSGTTATTTTADEYLAAGFSASGAVSISSPTNSFAIKEQVTVGSGGNATGAALLTRIVTATGTYSTGGTYASSNNYAATINTFKSASATITAGGAALSGVGRLSARGYYATPTLSILAAFGYTSTDPVPVWTDISTYGRSFTWQRGRQNELNQAAAGTASLTLHDPLSRFDPDNTASLFYPYVKPGLPVQAILFVGASMYSLFYGYAERLPRTQRVSSTYTQRQIDLVDGFALLAYAGLGGDTYAVENSGTRVTNVLDNTGWPSTKRTIGTGSETLQDIAFPAEDTTTALTHLQAVDASEDGLLYMDGAGKLVFIGRASLDTSSKATFIDTAPAATPATGIDSNTVLMLHADGADASTTFSDSSQYAHTVTANGGAQVDTAQSVFGGASALFASSDYLSTPDHADFDFGAGDFTIDFRIRFNAFFGARVILAKMGASFGEFLVYLSTQTLQFYASSTGTSWNLVNGATIIPTASAATWYHIAIVRSGSTITYYVNGTSAGTSAVGASALANTTDAVTVGGISTATGLDGWMDEIRIRSTARWTANFTPPAAAYAGAVAPVGGGYTYIDLVPSFDLDNVFNRWTVTRDNGSPQTYEDTTSQQRYFLRAKQTQTLVSDDAAALAQATRKIGKFKDPLNRVETMTIQPLVDLTDTARIDAGLGRDIGHVITIKETPPGFAAVQTKNYVIQQIAGQIVAGPTTTMQLTFGVWPA